MDSGRAKGKRLASGQTARAKRPASLSSAATYPCSRFVARCDATPCHVARLYALARLATEVSFHTSLPEHRSGWRCTRCALHVPLSAFLHLAWACNVYRARTVLELLITRQLRRSNATLAAYSRTGAATAIQPAIPAKIVSTGRKYPFTYSRLIRSLVKLGRLEPAREDATLSDAIRFVRLGWSPTATVLDESRGLTRIPIDRRLRIDGVPR